MSQFGRNLDHFRYVGERNDRFAKRLGIGIDRLSGFLAGELPNDSELDSMAQRLNVHTWELFSGAVWPGSYDSMFKNSMTFYNAGV